MSVAVDSTLSIRNLKVGIRNGRQTTEIVKGVSFDVEPGKTLAIVGESGSGKSITAMSIMRLIGRRQNAVLSGEVMLDGQNLLELNERAMQKIRGRRIGMIFQEPMTSLNPVMTLGEQLTEVLEVHRGLSRKDARQEVLTILDRVRIAAGAQRLKDYPHQISGGMRQRMMIAMALACRPQFLLADEPTTALDVTVQAQILGLIRELQAEENMGVLFITHDMGVVAELADNTTVMFRGEVVESGATTDIFARPKAIYTRGLLAAVPHLGALADDPLPRKFPTIDPATGDTIAAAPRPSTVAETAGPVLKVSNLVTRFDVRAGLPAKVVARVHAVENVSFDLKPGETLALVGESGCGKSTTGQTIMGLIKPTSGSVEVNGVDISGLSAEELRAYRQHMQMVFQDPYASLDPRQTIGDAIIEPMRVHGKGTAAEREDKMKSLLTKVGLSPEMSKRFPHEFSGGQRQRVCIARALALDPKFIVADESVSALDVSVKAQVVNLLLDLQQELNIAYLFISHDMAVVERVSHRVAVMYLGEIVEIGKRADVLGNPQHSYTKRLLSSVPVPDPARRVQRVLASTEVPNAIRAADYVSPTRNYFDHGNGHLVMVDAH